MLVPIISSDAGKIIKNIDVYFRNLPITHICLIGDAKLKEIIPCDTRINFMDENSIVDFEKIRSLIVSRTGDEKSGERTGWYVQQFVKMGYCRICKDEYYLLWDSDTIPLKKIDFFDNNGYPLFDCKGEYHKPYFDAINRIFPGFSKQIKDSFISEHMIIRVDYMREMLDDIENNKNIKGNDFTEKIINSVNIDDLSKSGFSEFETYGSYVMKKHVGFYNMRRWKSMRFGGLFIDGSSKIQNKDIKWLSKEYDAISFEKRDNISSLSKILPMLENNFSPLILELFAFFIRLYRKIIGKR